MSAPAPETRPPWQRYLAAVALLGLMLAGSAWFTRPDGRLRVFFLNTPGDAILVQAPNGGYTLIDSGADPMLLAVELGRRLPFWQRNLEAVVLTRGDGGRLPGQVAALARYRARVALAPPRLPETGAAREWLRLLAEQRTPVRVAQSGDRLNLGGAMLTVLATGDGDEAGLVLRLDYGATSVILGGAGGERDDAALLAGAQPATVLAYPWQRDPLTPLVRAWQPQAIVFTSAYEAHHPAQLTMRERALNGATVYHEKLDGTVTLLSNGRRAWIERAK